MEEKKSINAAPIEETMTFVLLGSVLTQLH